MTPSSAVAVDLVKTLDPGYYNNSIGRLLNLSNTGQDSRFEPFPISNDSAFSYPTAPILDSASIVLGDWLSQPENLNSYWSATPVSIPNSWAVNTEVAIIYQFDTLAATNVVAEFGVDNGLFAWLNGDYLFGARGPGAVRRGEYRLDLGDLSAGTYYLQLLLEDHGSRNGYDVLITADSFIPAPAPSPDPAPAPSPDPAPPPTNSVPGPLPVLGVGAAFGFSRKLRNRIKSSKLPVASAID